MSLGAHRAIAAINASGGVAGQPVRLTLEDDGCAAGTADAAARRIVAASPALVVGHPCPGGAIAAAKVYGAARVLFIATVNRHPGLTARRPGPTVFRLDGRDDRQGDFAAAELQRRAAGGAIALVSDRTVYARRIVGAARTAIAAAGGKEPLMLSVVAGDKDFSAQVGEIARSGAAAVLFAGFPLEAAILLRHMRAAGITATFIGTDATIGKDFLHLAGDAAAGALAVLPMNAGLPGAATPTAPDTDTASHAATAPSAAAVRTEAAIQLWADAARRAGSLHPVAVAAELQRHGGSSAFGPITFNASGDAGLTAFQLVEPSRVISARTGAARPIEPSRAETSPAASSPSAPTPIAPAPPAGSQR